MHNLNNKQNARKRNDDNKNTSVYQREKNK